MLPKWHKIASVTLYNARKGLRKTKNNDENGKIKMQVTSFDFVLKNSGLYGLNWSMG